LDGRPAVFAGERNFPGDNEQPKNRSMTFRPAKYTPANRGGATAPA